MSEYRKVITKPGEVLAYETVFEENPYLRTGVPRRMGTVERIDYSTAVYENGKTYHGLDKLCLNNIIQDNTYMKDYLAYTLMYDFGVDAVCINKIYPEEAMRGYFEGWQQMQRESLQLAVLYEKLAAQRIQLSAY